MRNPRCANRPCALPHMGELEWAQSEGYRDRNGGTLSRGIGEGKSVKRSKIWAAMGVVEAVLVGRQATFLRRSLSPNTSSGLAEGLRRLPALNNAAHHHLSTCRREPGILMNVHSVPPRWPKPQQLQLPRSEPNGQPIETSHLVTLPWGQRPIRCRPDDGGGAPSRRRRRASRGQVTVGALAPRDPRGRRGRFRRRGTRPCRALARRRLSWTSAIRTSSRPSSAARAVERAAPPQGSSTSRR